MSIAQEVDMMRDDVRQAVRWGLLAVLLLGYPVLFAWVLIRWTTG